jgi:hypothetical protein
MEFDPASIVPPPPPGHLEALEDYYDIKLPDDYKRFVVTLPVIQDVEDHPLGWLELEVVASQLDSRLSDDEDGENINLIPIAALFAGNFVVLDYRKGPENPTVGFWDHEASEDFAPAVTTVARSFSEFLSILK